MFCCLIHTNTLASPQVARSNGLAQGTLPALQPSQAACFA